MTSGSRRRRQTARRHNPTKDLWIQCKMNRDLVVIIISINVVDKNMTSVTFEQIWVVIWSNKRRRSTTGASHHLLFWEIMSHFSPHVTIFCFENNRKRKKTKLTHDHKRRTRKNWGKKHNYEDVDRKDGCRRSATTKVYICHTLVPFQHRAWWMTYI